MKIRWTNATGCPAGQFVVEAENKQDEVILEMFLTFPDHAKEKWEFWRHGASYRMGYKAFNFGYIVRKEVEKKNENTTNRLEEP